MPTFGRSAKPNNRSQHNLAVDSVGPSAGAPSAATGPGSDQGIGIGISTSGAPSPSSSQSQQPQLQQQQQQQQQQHQHQHHQQQQLLQQQQQSSPPGPGPGPGPIPGPGHSSNYAHAHSHAHAHTHSHAHAHAHAQLQQGPSSASALGQGPANLPLTSNDSFVQDLRAASQNQQLSLSHLYAPAAGDLPPNHHPQGQAQLHQLQPLNTGTVVSNAKVRKAASDFVDAVARSQSQRYNQVATPIQPNPSYGASYEDLSRTVHATPQAQQPFAYQQHQQHQHPHQHQEQAPPPPPPPHHHQQQQQQQQQQQGAPVEPRRSTRRLIKNILGGAPKLDQSRSERSHHPSPSQSQSQSQSHNFYDSTAALARRSSKRFSNPNPPAIRTGPSQVSLDQQSLDWQTQQAQGSRTQPSPLQTVGAVPTTPAPSSANLTANHTLPLQNPPEFQQPTLRRVPTNPDQSPYSDVDESSFRQAGQLHAQTQPLTPEHHQQLGQVAFDPATRQYQFIAQSPRQSPQGPLQPDGNPPTYSGYLGTEHLQNSETISQLSHESPVGEGEQQNHSNLPSSTASPAVRYSQSQDFPSRTSSLPPQQPSQDEPEEQHSMAPPSGGPTQARRQDDKGMRGDMPQGQPPGYRHSQQPSNSMNSMPAGQGGAGQNNFRQSTIQERQQQQFDGAAEQGRNSPQPSEDPEKAFKDLLNKYKNVKRLYFDGKSQIESLNGQVEQLQNAVANQRISQSRTALDDNEYTTRFNRLSGAIMNLSFNIRKDWTSVPAWLDKYVSADALKTGKQEMTAVGRAVITRWIVDEIFFSCFHPGLDPELSRQLKQVEQNIRRFSYTMTSQEEFDALTAKVVSWRMTTLEGLQDVLSSPESENHRQEFTRNATANLTACLFQHLADPPPAGVDGSASMIVELAVGIAANLPLESRDVAILYPLPQDGIQPEIMDVEKTPLPAIETRPVDSDGDADSREDAGRESGGEKSSNKERNKSRSGTSAISTISNMFTSAPSTLVPAALVPGSATRKDGSVSASLSVSQQDSGRKLSNVSSVADSPTTLALPPKDNSKVRFAGFLAVEVRGRQVLVKAPVWPLG